MTATKDSPVRLPAIDHNELDIAKALTAQAIVEIEDGKGLMTPKEKLRVAHTLAVIAVAEQVKRLAEQSAHLSLDEPFAPSAEMDLTEVDKVASNQ